VGSKANNIRRVQPGAVLHSASSTSGEGLALGPDVPPRTRSVQSPSSDCENPESHRSWLYSISSVKTLRRDQPWNGHCLQRRQIRISSSPTNISPPWPQHPHQTWSILRANWSQRRRKIHHHLPNRAHVLTDLGQHLSRHHRHCKTRCSISR